MRLLNEDNYLPYNNITTMTKRCKEQVTGPIPVSMAKVCTVPSQSTPCFTRQFTSTRQQYVKVGVCI